MTGVNVWMSELGTMKHCLCKDLTLTLGNEHTLYFVFFSVFILSYQRLAGLSWREQARKQPKNLCIMLTTIESNCQLRQNFTPSHQHDIAILHCVGISFPVTNSHSTHSKTWVKTPCCRGTIFHSEVWGRRFTNFHYYYYQRHLFFLRPPFLKPTPLHFHVMGHFHSEWGLPPGSAWRDQTLPPLTSSIGLETLHEETGPLPPLTSSIVLETLREETGPLPPV